MNVVRAFTRSKGDKCPRKLQNQLSKLEADQVPVFSFNGLETWCLCTDVYDGDTITVLFKRKKEYIKEKIRLAKINTPEIRTKDEEEKAKGIEARDYVKFQIEHKYIWVKFGKREKYGRSLGTIFLEKSDTDSLNDLLVVNGYAEKYMG